jgi:hypothetical protein
LLDTRFPERRMVMSRERVMRRGMVLLVKNGALLSGMQIPVHGHQSSEFPVLY